MKMDSEKKLDKVVKDYRKELDDFKEEGKASLVRFSKLHKSQLMDANALIKEIQEAREEYEQLVKQHEEDMKKYRALIATLHKEVEQLSRTVGHFATQSSLAM